MKKTIALLAAVSLAVAVAVAEEIPFTASWIANLFTPQQIDFGAMYQGIEKCKPLFESNQSLFECSVWIKGASRNASFDMLLRHEIFTTSSEITPTPYLLKSGTATNVTISSFAPPGYRLCVVGNDIGFTQGQIHFVCEANVSVTQNLTAT